MQKRFVSSSFWGEITFKVTTKFGGEVGVKGLLVAGPVKELCGP